MRSSDFYKRLVRLEVTTGNQPCGTCYGSGGVIMMVPHGADEEASEYRPTHCRECGILLRNIQRIIGISEEEMFGPLESAG